MLFGFGLTPPGDQNKGKIVEKTFLIVSPLLLYKINKNAAPLKGKWISFSPVHYLINIIKPLQRKTMFHCTPGSVPFNPTFFFGIFFMLAFHHITVKWFNKKKWKKLPNVNKCQGITPIFLFFHNLYLYLNGSVKKKNVPHSPGLHYFIP